MSLAILLVIAHFCGDWLCQPRWMAHDKSKHFRVLLGHLIIVTLAIMILPIGPLLMSWHLTGLLLINMGCHGFIDWFGPRLYMAIRGEDLWRKDLYQQVHTTPQYASDDINHAWLPLHEPKHDYGWFSYIALDQMAHLVILFSLFLP